MTHTTRGLFVLGVVLTIGVLAFAQTATFEVASVKRNTSGGGSRSSHSAGRLTEINVTLRSMILAAYRLEGFRLFTTPDWVDSDRFDIVAKAAGNPTVDELNVMMQHLLAERFQLAVHYDTREMAVYDLVLARTDRKLGPAMRRVDCAKPTCGTEFIDSNVLRAEGVPVAFVTRRLSSSLGRVVNDKTGLDGHYAIDLAWSEDQTTDATQPSIFTALQEQLGLKLVSARGPVEVLVIDRVEQPSPD